MSTATASAIRSPRQHAARLWRCAALAAAMVVAATTARAADPAPRPAPESVPDLALDFHGIAAASLAASQLSSDSIQCGLDLEQLADAARQPAADAGLGLRTDATTRITVSAITVRLPAAEQCVTAVLLGAYTQESFFSGNAGWMRNGYFVVWQRSLMVSTPVAQHPAAVHAAVGRLAEQMLTAWRAQNPRPAPVAAATDGAGKP